MVCDVRGVGVISHQMIKVCGRFSASTTPSCMRDSASQLSHPHGVLALVPHGHQGMTAFVTCHGFLPAGSQSLFLPGGSELGVGWPPPSPELTCGLLSIPPNQGLLGPCPELSCRQCLWRTSQFLFLAEATARSQEDLAPSQHVARFCFLLHK
jgi:hypothetical protein